eukprot:324084_1
MEMTKEEKDSMVTSWAALALHDGDADVTSDQIKTLCEATGNEVEGYWSLLFADYLQKASIDKLLVTVGSGGGGSGGGGGGDAAAVEEKKEEEEEEEEVDIGAGMDMFGDGGGGDY